MASKKKTSRIAGLLYLVVVITGIISLMYVPSKLVVQDDAAATFRNIAGSGTLFRIGIVSGLICYAAFLFLPVVLYKLLKPVNESYAAMMVLLAVVSVPISFINMQHKLAVLSLVNGSVLNSGFSAIEVQSQVLFYLEQYNNGILIVSIFWGLWLFPFGYLVFKSGFLPKILGLMLMVGCIGYIINFLGEMLIPGYSKSSLPAYISIPSGVGEIGTCLWLLIVGVREKKRIE